MTRCRRRVHLEHDPAMREVPLPPPDMGAQQRMADAAAHRAQIARVLAESRAEPDDWVTVPAELTLAARVRRTAAALEAGAGYISGALLPADRAGGRRGGVELLVRTAAGYVPIIVVRHRITDPGDGAPTTALTDLDPSHVAADPKRKLRSHPRDQLRLAHLRRLLQACGRAEPERAVGGVIGLDADVVVWHDLAAGTWPGGRSTLGEYDARFSDRQAVARAAATGGEALAQPSRVLECRGCPWWSVCETELHRAEDVSLVVRGDVAGELRAAGITTVKQLASLDPQAPPPVNWSAGTYADMLALAKAWLADLTVVRRVDDVSPPRADVELDVDMENFGDSGAYLWGCLLSGADIGIGHGYHSFATWSPLPSTDEARSFAEFWAFLRDVRARAAERGLSFRAYCYNALAENRWLYASAQRFAGMPGVPDHAEVAAFVDSDEWVDLFRSVSESFLCSHGKGLKVVAPVAGFEWRDAEAGGEASMWWYQDAVGMHDDQPDLAQRKRLLAYNEDDVRATYVLREWMSGPAGTEVPFMGEL